MLSAIAAAAAAAVATFAGRHMGGGGTVAVAGVAFNAGNFSCLLPLADRVCRCEAVAIVYIAAPPL